MFVNDAVLISTPAMLDKSRNVQEFDCRACEIRGLRIEIAAKCTQDCIVFGQYSN